MSKSDVFHLGKRRATESFYGRRKGQQLHGRKARVMEELLPGLLLDVTTPSPLTTGELFSGSSDRCQLEIGFGGGEHLTFQAHSNPNTSYIGVEPFINGMAKMLGAIEDGGLDNIRLYNDDATQLLDWLPAGSLDQIDLLYPDPWPKRRHWKRRFINQKNLSRIAKVLKPGGVFRFASDIDTYINWTLNHVEHHGAFNWQVETSADWNSPWSGWTRTRYEAKAVREGRTPCYLEFALAANV